MSDLMWPINGVTITPLRPTYDAMGNATTWTSLEPIDNALFALDPPSPVYTERGDAYTQSGNLFAPKGSGLQNGDRVLYQSRTWDVIGEAEWDMVHPMTGDDFGYVAFAINWGG